MALHIWQVIRVELLGHVLRRVGIGNVAARLELMRARLELLRLALLHARVLGKVALLRELSHVRVARLSWMPGLLVTRLEGRSRRAYVCVGCSAHSSLSGMNWSDAADLTDGRLSRSMIIVKGNWWTYVKLIRGLKWLSWIRHSVDHPLWLKRGLTNLDHLALEARKTTSCNDETSTYN